MAINRYLSARGSLVFIIPGYLPRFAGFTVFKDRFPCVVMEKGNKNDENRVLIQEFFQAFLFLF
jgi:hypothetical protein